MLTVGKDAREVERKLEAGQFACPSCGGRLAPWSHARTRIVFGDGTLRWRLRPRRARCAACERRLHAAAPAEAYVSACRHARPGGCARDCIERRVMGGCCAGRKRRFCSGPYPVSELLYEAVSAPLVTASYIEPDGHTHCRARARQAGQRESREAEHRGGIGWEGRLGRDPRPTREGQGQYMLDRFVVKVAASSERNQSNRKSCLLESN